ncbi:MAG: hypothetical protein ACFE85_06785 [Candidatus Hodarchaeota archaeon]
MKTKVEGRYIREITIDNDDDSIVYVFPDTKGFISIIKRDLNKKLISEEKL